MHNQYPSDKSLSTIFDPSTPPQGSSSRPSYPSPTTATESEPFIRSPTIPSSPAPAYTALPHRDVDFHFTPMLEGKVGEVELETIDGKRFLVHKKVLEQETVFFHIYYGFVPVWRLNAASSSSSSSSENLAIPIHQATSVPPSSNTITPRTTTQGLNSLFCLPKIIVNTLSRNSVSASPCPPPPAFENHSLPPPLPPKDNVTAPTPTSSPYTWVVPESSTVLVAFLSLIYPRGIITRSPNDLLDSLEITSKVVRASLGYQSSKALNISRDRLSHWMIEQPIETYSMASFFKFNDLIKLSSSYALSIPPERWSEETNHIMGRKACNKLIDLQHTRLEGLKSILNNPMERDEHSCGCVRFKMAEQVWISMTKHLKEDLKPEMELLELLQVDLRGGHCGDCLVLLGKSIQKAILEAKELPKSL
ncbi:uncharacterized protein IL334_004217 [Kwoniella shivajii]|uniref:BTB domain-containing protein n=1 Tax=Kwoniella shivajii TaxID=564305 RepID=A0ABZ1D1G5_9TREE|nr:hypothetical protein IL334_004217 [Kwoniella shivajii]